MALSAGGIAQLVNSWVSQGQTEAWINTELDKLVKQWEAGTSLHDASRPGIDPKVLASIDSDLPSGAGEKVDPVISPSQALAQVISQFDASVKAGSPLSGSVIKARLEDLTGFTGGALDALFATFNDQVAASTGTPGTPAYEQAFAEDLVRLTSGGGGAPTGAISRVLERYLDDPSFNSGDVLSAVNQITGNTRYYFDNVARRVQALGPEKERRLQVADVERRRQAATISDLDAQALAAQRQAEIDATSTVAPVGFAEGTSSGTAVTDSTGGGAGFTDSGTTGTGITNTGFSGPGFTGTGTGDAGSIVGAGGFLSRQQLFDEQSERDLFLRGVQRATGRPLGGFIPLAQRALNTAFSRFQDTAPITNFFPQQERGAAFQQFLGAPLTQAGLQSNLDNILGQFRGRASDQSPIFESFSRTFPTPNAALSAAMQPYLQRVAPRLRNAAQTGIFNMFAPQFAADPQNFQTPGQVANVFSNFRSSGF